jgi:hypothetical protein
MASSNADKELCHTCGHSDKHFSLEKRILNVINESEIELTPRGLAEKLHEKFPDFEINHSSIRKFCRRLLEKNLLLQPYPGSYCNKITYGMRFVPLTVHNVGLRVNLCEDVVSWKVDEFVGDVKIHVCFGSERRKVSGYIANDFGMGKDACLFAIHRWFDIAENHLGRSLPEPLELTSFEQNRDYKGLRIDGVQCVTKKGLDGMIERVYQKEEGLVRAEHKVSKSMTFTEFESLLQGGVGGYNQTQAQFALMQQVGALTEALKFTNSRLLGIEKQNQALMKWIVDHNGKADSVA